MAAAARPAAGAWRTVSVGAKASAVMRPVASMVFAQRVGPQRGCEGEVSCRFSASSAAARDLCRMRNQARHATWAYISYI
eukprot:343562-Prymnesium_polylepis.1